MTSSAAALFDSLGLTDSGGAFARAVARGVRAPDLGEAFYEGYQSALIALVSNEIVGVRGTFCVTESGGGHPRSMLCALRRDGDDVVLEGDKTFVTGADRAKLLFVVARENAIDDPRPSLRLVRVPIDASGVSLHPLGRTPFAPDIHHARVELRGVRLPADAVLAGDGYTTYVKPFRTVEDVHVVAAIAAHLAGVLDEVGDHARVERLLALVLALAELAKRPPLDPATHRALAGTLDLLSVSLEDVTDAIAAHPDEATKSGIARDLALLKVAESVRRKRLETARGGGG